MNDKIIVNERIIHQLIDRLNRSQQRQPDQSPSPAELRQLLDEMRQLSGRQ